MYYYYVFIQGKCGDPGVVGTVGPPGEKVSTSGNGYFYVYIFFFYFVFFPSHCHVTASNLVFE